MLRKCPQCGASFDEDLPACPYCTNLNYEGAEKEYLNSLNETQKKLSELSDDSEEEFKNSIKSSFGVFKKTLIVVICVVLALVLIFFVGSFILNHIGRGSSAQEQIRWKNQYAQEWNDMYEAGDYDGMSDFLMKHIVDDGYYPYDYEHIDFITAYGYNKSLLEYMEDDNLISSQSLPFAIYDALRIEELPEVSYYHFSDEELELVKSYAQTSKTFYRDVLGFSDAQVAEMKEYVTGDYGAIDFSKCRKYIKKIK